MRHVLWGVLAFFGQPMIHQTSSQKHSFRSLWEESQFYINVFLQFMVHDPPCLSPPLPPPASASLLSGLIFCVCPVLLCADSVISLFFTGKRHHLTVLTRLKDKLTYLFCWCAINICISKSIPKWDNSQNDDDAPENIRTYIHTV